MNNRKEVPISKIFTKIIKKNGNRHLTNKLYYDIIVSQQRKGIDNNDVEHISVFCNPFWKESKMFFSIV